MKKYIERIYGTIENTNIKIDINTKNKNLIITGPNGSGKTHFLSNLHKTITNHIMMDEQDTYEYKIRRIPIVEQMLKNSKVKDDNFYNLTSELRALKINLFYHDSKLNINTPDFRELSSKTEDLSAVNLLFSAHRQAGIATSDAARGLENEKNIYKAEMKNNRVGGSLEKHLVNLKTRSTYAIAHERDSSIAQLIEKWFSDFEQNLKFLMEDESTVLNYNPDTLKFTIRRKNKLDTDLQSLSSGYASILDIYSELLMRAAYLDIPPNTLCGTALIDELEVHLHVSLQRLILPFLENSFPNIQFIITTHSPFILTSISNSVVYDIGANVTTDKDLSLYSYSAVMEGLLGTRTTSKILDEIISEIAALTQSKNGNNEKLRQYVNKISASENELDSRSKAFYLLGINSILDEDQKDV